MASGFLAGRAIWLEAFEHYPDWAAIRCELESGAVDYLAEIAELAERQAKDWRTHACYGGEGARFSPANAGFRSVYEEFRANE